jgi:hypothetical protein
MALKTGEVAATKPVTVLLELALYKRYMRLGVFYESGVIYKVTKEQAVILLGEQDNGKALWKVYRPARETPSAEVQKARNVVDATTVKVVATPQDADPSQPRQTRIEIGNDEEIASILEKEDVVTV